MLVAQKGRVGDKCLHPRILISVQAFTLVELLVVTMLIAVLAALLLPASTQANAKVQSIKCRSNLHQMGVGLRLYLDDSGGVYPYAANGPAVNSRGCSYWFDALARVLPDARWGEGIFRCPAYRGIVFEGAIKTGQRGELLAIYYPCGSYAYNAAGRRVPESGRHLTTSPGLGFVAFAGHLDAQPVKESDVRAPSNLYVFGDGPLSLAAWGTVATPSLGGAADYDSLLADNARIEKVQHSVVFNMLFADIHSESVRTGVLLSTNAIYHSRWNHDSLP